jgi:hypothetical protein
MSVDPKWLEILKASGWHYVVKLGHSAGDRYLSSSVGVRGFEGWGRIFSLLMGHGQFDFGAIFSTMLSFLSFPASSRICT